MCPEWGAGTVQPRSGHSIKALGAVPGTVGVQGMLSVLVTVIALFPGGGLGQPSGPLVKTEQRKRRDDITVVGGERAGGALPGLLSATGLPALAPISFG